MSFIQRFSNIRRGGIVFTGNTLGLSKRDNLNQSGLLGSIGAFTSLNQALQVATFPVGTTLNYVQNGSRANLNLPANSTVLYAELIWGGLYMSSVNNISNLIDNPISFTTPNGVFSILGDNATKQDFVIPLDNNLVIGVYVRTANVTNLLTTNFNGSYSVSGVPALIEALESRTQSTNHAGWTLAVVYENSNLPLRDLTLWTGGTVVSPLVGTTDVSLTGFITPEVLPITGKIFVSSGEGDAVLSGDQMLFGANIGSLSNLSGPNNPQTNFFASQINDENGLLDTTGTFGNRNANAQTGTNTSACRQGWDITAVDISNKLQVNQNTASIRFTSTGDLYIPNALAIQVDSKGANIVATKSADRDFARIGEEIEYTINLTNTGSITANNVVINDVLPNGMTLVNNSIFVDGVQQPDTLPINIGSVVVNQEVVVQFKVVANSIPNINPVLNTARVDYEFNPFSGTTVSSSTNTNTETVFIISPSLSILKLVDKVFAVQGDELTYTSTITNTGTTPIINVIFTDTTPAGTEFIVDSVTIDGVAYAGYDPNVGFNVGNLSPAQDVEIKFKVRVL